MCHPMYNVPYIANQVEVEKDESGEEKAVEESPVPDPKKEEEKGGQFATRCAHRGGETWDEKA